jgi:outer membrane protein TolC
MKPRVLGGGLGFALLIGLIGSARALDLETVLREVDSANPTLAARRAEVEAARSRVGPAGAWPAPMVELGAINVPAGGGFDRDPMTMEMIGLTQRVPVFGGNRLRRASAEAAIGAAAAASETARFELLGMAWEAYADAYCADQLVRSAAAHQSEMDRLVRAAQARYASGNGRLDDVLRAEAERARSFADLASYESEARGAAARLQALRGRDPATAIDSLQPLPFVVLPERATAWETEAQSHPRLRELRNESERDRLTARASRRAVWPDLELSGSYGFRRPINGMAQDDMWSATVGFMLPLFAGQREGSEAAEMDAMARAKDAELQAARLDVEQQIVATHAAALSNRRTVTLLADTVLATERRAVEASWSSYVAGASDLWRVFEATHTVYEEEIALLRARRDLAHAEARLLALTARGDLFGLSLSTPGRSER